MPNPPLFEARAISKLYGAFAANASVDLTLQPGEIHALLGENGAGKSTLVKMIYGVAAPSGGAFFWRGEPYAPTDPAAARARGVGMVFQHFSLFDALSVQENISLALPPTPARRLRAAIRETSERYGLTIDPDRSAHSLSVGEKQRVEILRCLLQEPELLIMDEPTSVLTPQEAERLFEVLRRLSQEGKAVLYISHRLEEIRSLCDQATVLRRGKVVGACDPRKETPHSLAEMMIGDSVAEIRKAPRPAAQEAAPMLALKGLSLPAPAPDAAALKEISLTVRPGEILGLAGVAGEGQAELMAALTGETRAPAGTIEIAGVDAGRLGPTARRALGAGFCPEERNGHAALAEMRLSENALLTLHRVEKLAEGGVIRPGRMRAWAARVRKTFDVRAEGPDPVAASLSGGNLQKFVMGRELLRDLKLFVVSQPTWGVDAGAAAVIRQALADLAEAGGAVLMISQDLDEIFAISDRIAAIYHGRISPAYPAAEMTPEKIGLLMGGHALEAA